MLHWPAVRRAAWAVCAVLLVLTCAWAADGPALLLLDRSAKNGALNMGGQDKLLVQAGGLVVNSSHASGLFNANSTIEVKDGGIGVVGGFRNLGTATTNPAPTRCQPVDDPFAQLKVPVATERRSTREAVYNRGAEAHLEPGLYYGGLLIGDKSTVTLEPGEYVFVNASIRMTGGAKLVGTGVTVIMSGNQPGMFLVGGESSVDLSPPTEGDLKGLTLMSYRTDDALSFNDGHGRIKGTAYAPRGRLGLFYKSSVTIDRVVALHLSLNTGSTLEVTGQ